MLKQQIDNGYMFSANGAVAEVAINVQEFFVEQGYKLESGSNTDAVYGCGNDILRILLGAFYKRFKFHVVVADQNGKATVTVSESSFSKVSGGVIGYKKYKAEMDKLTGLLEGMSI